ncbi:hypothetical protein GPECTOR_18g143 [Gonium pectorale]|uniref:Uncharacterized protein n=1 Tax=Gonium pectorale TaxID=33097 RepID=A0A150GJK7_GONPE|nr:hypothetical protein GPECTOR_18g143 [Gonium pectorale]|eukprot:KXZ49987.1 hypothetical protein GPECTOR_18g143 [Gonium pectorale]
MVIERWMRRGAAPTAAEISAAESLVLPSDVWGGVLPLRITPLDRLAPASPLRLRELLREYDGEQYVLCVAGSSSSSSSSSSSIHQGRHGVGGGDTSGRNGGGGGWRRWLPGSGSGGPEQPSVLVSFSDRATPNDILKALLHAACLRKPAEAPGGSLTDVGSADAAEQRFLQHQQQTLRQRRGHGGSSGAGGNGGGDGGGGPVGHSHDHVHWDPQRHVLYHHTHYHTHEPGSTDFPLNHHHSHHIHPDRGDGQHHNGRDTNGTRHAAHSGPAAGSSATVGAVAPAGEGGGGGGEPPPPLPVAGDGGWQPPPWWPLPQGQGAGGQRPPWGEIDEATWASLLERSRREAARSLPRLLQQAEQAGWRLKPFMLNTTERVQFVRV